MKGWILLVVVSHAAGASELLGAPIRGDGFTVRPPAGFRVLPMEAYQGTRSGAVGQGPDRSLSMALENTEGEEATTMLVAVVEGSFDVNPGARDEFSTSVVRHFNDELGLRFSMERADLVTAPWPRVDVLGSVKGQDQIRHVLVSALAGDRRHAVITFSVPSGQWEERAGPIRMALDSYRGEGVASKGVPRGVAAVLAVLIGLLLAASLALWRRRRMPRW